MGSGKRAEAIVCGPPTSACAGRQCHHPISRGKGRQGMGKSPATTEPAWRNTRMRLSRLVLGPPHRSSPKCDHFPEAAGPPTHRSISALQKCPSALERPARPCPPFTSPSALPIGESRTKSGGAITSTRATASSFSCWKTKPRHLAPPGNFHGDQRVTALSVFARTH